MLRLEAFAAEHKLKELVEFQLLAPLMSSPPSSARFQCGAIRRHSLPVTPMPERLFQFQCGAIRRGIMRLQLFLALGFQFQCGAIRSVVNGRIIKVRYQFQFQCGAIRSTIIFALNGSPPRFNSSVVRFIAQM